MVKYVKHRDDLTYIIGEMIGELNIGHAYVGGGDKPKATRIRRKYSELTEADIGKIAVSGPVAILLVGLIARIAGFNEFAMLCSWFAFLSLIPIGQGFKLFNSSRITWVFAFIFSLFIMLLMNVTMVFATIIIALLLAAIITIAYYSMYEK